MTANETANAMAKEKAAQLSKIAHLIGRVYRDSDGTQWRLIDCNDLGVLYWNKLGQRALYAIAGWRVSDALDGSIPFDR